MAGSSSITRMRSAAEASDRRSSAGTDGARASGTRIVKAVPRPGVLRTSIRPLWLCTRPHTVLRPSPVPSSGPLVVKNGSKMRRCVSASMPIPVSLTESTPSSPSRDVAIVSVPPAGIASTALKTRLERISSQAAPVLEMGGTSARSSSTRTVRPSRSGPAFHFGCVRSMVSRTTRRRSTDSRRWVSIGRPKVWMRLTTAAHCSADSTILRAKRWNSSGVRGRDSMSCA